MEGALVVPDSTTYIPPSLDMAVNVTNSAQYCLSALTEEAYLTCTRGPKHLSLTIIVPLTVIYVFIFVTGVIGNIAVCVVIVRISSMHTATNYYLFNLAVSDLALLLLGLPNDIRVFWQQYPWPFGEVVCKFRALVSEMTSYASVLTIVAFSLERYVAICHPLHSYRMSGLKRALKIIAILWVIALIAAIPFAVFTKVHYEYWPKDGPNKTRLEESSFCAMLESNMVYESSSFLFFFLPMLLLVVLYARIGRKIGSRARPRHALGTALDEQRQHGQSRRAIIRMLASVVIAFFLCWAPFHAQRLLYLYGKQLEHYTLINEWLFNLSGCFYYFGSTVNPILYNVMSVKYRMAFKEVLCGSISGHARGFREQSSLRDTSSHAAGTTVKNCVENSNNGVNEGVNSDVLWQRSPSICGNRICKQVAVNGSTTCSTLAPRPPPFPSPSPLSQGVTPNVVWSASAPSLTLSCSEMQSPTGSSDMVVRLSPGTQPRRPRCFTVGRMPRRLRSRAMRDTARDSLPSERMLLARPAQTTCNGAPNASTGHGCSAVFTGGNVETCI